MPKSYLYEMAGTFDNTATPEYPFNGGLQQFQ